MDELEDATVSTTVILDTPKAPVTNAGRVGKEDIKRQSYKGKFIPRKEYLQNHGNGQNHRDSRDCTCKACGYSNRELHKMIKPLHTGDPKTCFFRGSKFLNDKEL